MNEGELVERVAEKLQCSRMNVRGALREEPSSEDALLASAQLEELRIAYGRDRAQTDAIIRRAAALLRTVA